MIVCEGSSSGGRLAQLLPDAETAARWMEEMQAISALPIVWTVWQTEAASLRDADAARAKGKA